MFSDVKIIFLQNFKWGFLTSARHIHIEINIHIYLEFLSTYIIWDKDWVETQHLFFEIINKKNSIPHFINDLHGAMKDSIILHNYEFLKFYRTNPIFRLFCVSFT